MRCVRACVRVGVYVWWWWWWWRRRWCVHVHLRVRACVRARARVCVGLLLEFCHCAVIARLHMSVHMCIHRPASTSGKTDWILSGQGGLDLMQRMGQGQRIPDNGFGLAEDQRLAEDQMGTL